MKTLARHTRTLLAGWLLVLTYACTLPSVLPTAFAMFARMEGSHGIELTACAEETDVVLTHPGSEGRPHDAIHHHCLFARALAAFAESPRDDDPDHRVKFSGGVNRGLEKRTLVPNAPVNADTAAPELLVIAEVVLSQPVKKWMWSEFRPPRPPDGLVELKSTLLLV